MLFTSALHEALQKMLIGIAILEAFPMIVHNLSQRDALTGDHKRR